MTRMSTQISQTMAVVLGLVLAFAAAQSSAQLPSELTNEILQGAPQENSQEGVTVQLPQIDFTTVNTVVSVPDAGFVRNQNQPASQTQDPGAVSVPDASQNLMMTVTPDIVIQEEEESALFVFETQCPQCPSQCEKSCPSCPGSAAALTTEGCPATAAVANTVDRPDCAASCPQSCSDSCPACPQSCNAQELTPATSPTSTNSACPFGEACQGDCPATMPDSGLARLSLPQPPIRTSTCAEAGCNDCEKDICTELADTLSDSLSDSNIHPQSRRDILNATMKLLVRNADLEAKAEIAQMQLAHEREIALIRGHMYQLQGQMATVGEVREWMTPMYNSQTQTQQYMQSLQANLEMMNRSMRTLGNTPQPAMQSTQPRTYPNPQQWTQNSNPYPQPSTIRNQFVPQDRWSKLPSHMENPPVRRDKSTMNSNQNQNATPQRADTYLKTTTQTAPKRLSDIDVRREQLQNEISRVQRELKQLDDGSLVRAVSWNEPLGVSNLRLPSSQSSNTPLPSNGNQFSPLQPRIQPIQAAQPAQRIGTSIPANR